MRTAGQQAWFDRHHAVAAWLTVDEFELFMRIAKKKGLTVTAFALELLRAEIANSSNVTEKP